VIRHLRLPGAPQGLEIVVGDGANATRRGLAPRELDRLIATLLPGQTMMRFADGRPVVRGRDDLHLSLAHAAGVTALAVAPFAIGIDIECVDPTLDVTTFDPELFGRRDFASLQAQAGEVRLEHFYRLWTLKEARLKRFGRTLADSALPEILGEDERLGADMATGWLDRAGKRYCVGVCWAAAAPCPALASANC
jgi:hypothetical protein